MPLICGIVRGNSVVAAEAESRGPIDRCNGAAQMFFRDLHRAAEWRHIEELDDIPGAHPDAAVAGWAADEVFHRRAVDVNVAAEGVGVLELRAAQPEDAGDDGVAAGGVRAEDFARPLAMAEDCAERGAVPNFAGDFHAAKRGGEAVKIVPDAVAGSGNGKGGKGPAIFDDGDLLIGDTDDEAPI